MGSAGASVVACESDGDSPTGGGAGYIDASRRAIEAECACLGEDVEEACLEETDFFDDASADCIDDAVRGDSEGRKAFDCLVDATVDFANCLEGQSCADQFECEDGTAIPGSWECDGEPDCAGAEDEPDGCDPGCSGRYLERLEGCGDLPESTEEALDECFPDEE